ncbi:helix-turn-helix domain-containing protein [Arcicella lustrica]|uniref:AraC family transcriptional regulator n=1 Tax=Arcicella lustrica TaxID=2984196 RepID=A0ABU5SKL2_9BACT|nr:AraC family transcriptional regulator [Arcicella sp. DC25W]MEA5427840.1 AraC family transcriptional regulator [Arcicella sp. DC25W]
MMDTRKNIAIDWSSPDVLEQIVQNIKNPLENIISASQNSSMEHKNIVDEIIFSSSKEISDIVEEIMRKAKSKSLNITFQGRPEIFEIYEENQNVRAMCSDEIKPQKITKMDQEWLMSLEKEIYGCITKDYLSLYDLAFKMAVSERQLHRKIANLVCLTPNKYIRILRLHKAKQMIDNYIQNSISQIAYSVGYNDVHYFSTLFMCQYDVSPKDLIKTLR